jgi:hypothetical protein
MVSALVWSASAEGCSDSLVLRAPARKRLKSAGWDILSLSADVLELRSWRRMGVGGGFLLAAYVAIIAQPLVYGSLGTSIVALMTPVR